MKHSRIARAMFTMMLAMLVSVWLAPVAHAQLGGGIGDAVGGIGDAVGGGGTDSGGGGGGLIGGVTDGLEGDSGDSQTDDGTSSGGGGGLVGGVVGGTVDKVKETVDSGQETVEEVTNDNGGLPIGNVGTGLVGTVEETVDKVKNDLTGTGKKRQHSTRTGDRNTSSPVRRGSDVLGHSLAGALEADSKDISLAMEEAKALSAAPVAAADESLASQIGRIATEAAEQVAFPLALTMLVIGFLMIQNRIDKKDPKLALAPVDSEHDLLSFT